MKRFLSFLMWAEALFAIAAVVIRGLVYFGVRFFITASSANGLLFAAIALGGVLYISLLLGATYKEVHRPQSDRLSPRTWRFWVEFFVEVLPRSPLRYIDVLLDDPPTT